VTGHIYTTPYLGVQLDMMFIIYAGSFLFLKARWRPVGVKIRVWVCGERVGEGEGEVAIIGRNSSDKRAGELAIVGRNNSDKRTGQVAIIGWITVRKGQGRLRYQTDIDFIT
jgi:hypothetical protein